MNTDIVIPPDSRPIGSIRSERPVPRQRLTRLFTVELRKTIDTRSGRAMLASVLLLSLSIATWGTLRSWNDTLLFTEFLEAVALPVTLLIPVVGVLAMTSEWSQRTALTTFTLSPRRIPVLLSKIGAALLTGAVVSGFVVLLTLAAVPLASAITGAETSYEGMGASITGGLAAVALNILMGAAFGALISATPAALVAYFAAPLLWGTLGVELLGASAKWVDISGAIENVVQADLGGVWPQTLTSIGVWIVVPMVLGLVASTRREVK